jgi:hypothetical protein
MTTLSKKFRCEQLAGHADWAAHIVGYLHADPNADVRGGLLEALLSARQTYWLPGYVETAIRDLMSEQGAEDAPF